MNFWILLTDIGLLIGASLVLGGVFIRLGQSPIVGYLLAGVFLGGPGSLQLVSSKHEIEAIAEIGISLLLFSLGLEFSWKRIKEFNQTSLMGGVLQVLFTPIVIISVGIACGVSLKTSIVLGLLFTLSSTACVLRILQEKGDLDSFTGRNAISVLLIQDMALVPFAIIIPLLASDGTLQEVTRSVGLLLGSVILLVLGLYILINKVMVRFLGVFSLEQNRELAILMAVFVGIGAAWVSHEVGISPALGAFVAGMFLGSSPFSTQMRADVGPLKTVFLTLFFGSAGMVADPIWIFKNAPLVIGLSFGLICGKILVTTIIFKVLRQPFHHALVSGIFLGQVGEFAFVLSHLGNQYGILTEKLYLLVVSSTIVTLFMTPFLISNASRLSNLIVGRRQKVGQQDSDPEIHPKKLAEPSIFIVGFGPSGVAVAKRLIDLGRHPIVIDLNSNAEKVAHELSLQFFQGDAQKYEVLEHMGLKTAILVIITVPSKSAAITITSLVKSMAPHAKILVRSHYLAHKREIESLGAYEVIVDEEATAQHLAEACQRTLLLQ